MCVYVYVHVYVYVDVHVVFEDLLPRLISREVKKV